MDEEITKMNGVNPRCGAVGHPANPIMIKEIRWPHADQARKHRRLNFFSWGGWGKQREKGSYPLLKLDISNNVAQNISSRWLVLSHCDYQFFYDRLHFCQIILFKTRLMQLLYKFAHLCYGHISIILSRILFTVATNKLSCLKNGGAQISMFFTHCNKKK